MTHFVRYSRTTSEALRPSSSALRNTASQSSSGMRMLRSVVPLGMGHRDAGAIADIVGEFPQLVAQLFFAQHLGCTRGTVKDFGVFRTPRKFGFGWHSYYFLATVDRGDGGEQFGEACHVIVGKQDGAVAVFPGDGEGVLAGAVGLDGECVAVGVGGAEDRGGFGFVHGVGSFPVVCTYRLTHCVPTRKCVSQESFAACYAEVSA